MWISPIVPPVDEGGGSGFPFLVRDTLEDRVDENGDSGRDAARHARGRCGT